MKLSNLGATSPKEFNFIDPYTDQPTDIFVTVHPIKSRIGKDATHAMQLEIMKLLQDENNVVTDGDVKNLKPNIIKELSFNMLCSLVVSFKGIDGEDGKPIKLIREAFEQSTELADAVYNFANNLGNFLSE